MIDLSQLQTWLSQLGPWGILIGLALPFILNRLGVPLPVKPAPIPSPVDPPKFPLLSKVLPLIFGRGTTVKDVPTDVIAQLWTEADAALEEKKAGHEGEAAKVAALKPSK